VQDLLPLLTLVGFAVLLWLILVRPQARRQRELVRMQSSLEVGDEVMLTSGVFGSVELLDEEDGTVRVRIAEGVVIKVARQAIGQVVPQTDVDGRDDAVSEES
jgi:preprotein translocase subunit YajC